MALSFLAPNRTVLLVTDEVLYIYSVSARGASLVETVPWDADNFEENVASIIAKDCGGKPVLILNDMVEQHYRKERVPKKGVSVMDKGGMLKRKLNVAFPNYPVRAALPLKEKAVGKDKKNAADIYIFAAVPSSKQFIKSIGAAQLSLAPVAGLCLLPIEAADMVKKLAHKQTKKKEAKAKWVVFMGQHKHGGLRQIVVKNGELALTRMTPIVENDNDADIWAGEVYQEFKATMSYLSRFGYQPEDGLDVILISNASAGEAFESMLEQPCNFSSLTTVDAARLLNIPLGSQDDFRHADPLHVCWAGKKAAFTLPMKAQQLDRVSKPRKIATAASFLLVLATAFLSYQFFNVYSAISESGAELEDAEKRERQLNVRYQREVKRKEDLGFDIKLLQSSITVYDNLDKANVKPLSLFDDVGHALGRDMRVDRIIVTRPDKTLVQSVLKRDQSPPAFQATLQMTYPGTTNIDKGNEEVRQLQGRLQSRLPEHEVRITKLLKDYEYVEEIVVETGDLEKEKIQQDFVAEITIIGPPLDD